MSALPSLAYAAAASPPPRPASQQLSTTKLLRLRGVRVDAADLPSRRAVTPAADATGRGGGGGRRPTTSHEAHTGQYAPRTALRIARWRRAPSGAARRSRRPHAT